MAKYFCGITAVENKYTVSILDDNLNIIFIDNIDLSKLAELLRRKSISIISIDAPTSLYAMQADILGGKYPDKLIIKKRSLDSAINSRNLFTYSNRFNIIRVKFESLVELKRLLNNFGFLTRVSGKTEKCIIESYPDTSFQVMGCVLNRNASLDDVAKRKVEFLKSKGIHINNLIEKMKENMYQGIDTLCQAYTAYLYHTGNVTCYGNQKEGLLIIPLKGMFASAKSQEVLQKSSPVQVHTAEKVLTSPNIINRDFGVKVITEYCGAQYLYTNTDGIIRIDGLRPIKSYRPFTEIYEVKHIRMVQVIIGTTDGLRKVKAFLIPNQENSNSFRAANEEDKKKLDSFWGVHGDKRGYLIKFNRVDRLDVVKA